MKKLCLVLAHTMALALLLALSLSAFAQKGGTKVDAGSGSGAGLSSDVMDIAAGQTARLELKNTGEESVAVRLQFVDPEGKVLVQRDATIEAGGDDALDYPNNPPAGVTAKNPKGLHVNVRAQFETKGAKSIGWLRPVLHIIEDGKTIQLIEQNGFKEVRDVIPSDSTAIVGADSSNQIIVYGFTTAELTFNAQIATARLTVHNKGDAPVAVRLQFVDKEEKVLVQRDATIKPGGDEAVAFGNNPVDFPFTGGSAGRIRAQFGTTEPNGFLEPSLRIVENASGKSIESVGPEGFKEINPNVQQRRRLIRPPVVTPKVPPLKSGNGPAQPNSGNRAEVLGAAENAKHINPFQTTQVQSEPAQGARVTAAFLKADDGRMSGPCPLKVVFHGYIIADGPGTVEYTFTRSDGATAPVLKMEFAKAGTQQVTTDWTLGDVRTLPSYEGWQAIQILSPNELESSHETGAFSINCTQGDVARQPSTRGEQQPRVPDGGKTGYVEAGKRPTINGAGARDFAETYKRELPRLLGPQKQRFERDLSELKTFTEKLQPAFAEAQKNVGLDADAILAEFRAIGEEKDPARREQRAAEFQSRYDPAFRNLAEAMDIDLAGQRRQLGSLLGLPGGKALESKTLTFDIEDNRPQPSQPPPPAPDEQELLFIAPAFDGAGTAGDDNTHARADGNLSLHNLMAISGSAEHIAYVTKRLSVGAGVRRVRVYADAGGQYLVQAIGLLGYGSAEAIFNLRVMEGGHVLASDRVSLQRLISVGVGVQTVNDGRRVTLFGEFTRPHPEDASTYDIVVEIEGWAGAGGLGFARVDMDCSLNRLHVFMHRH